MATNEQEDSGGGGKTAIERVIEHHQLRTHEARSRVLQTQHVLTAVPRKPRLRLQQELLDYYFALKPLRNRPEVEDWWDDVVLSENWIKDRTVTETTSQEVVGDIETGVNIVEETTEEVDLEYYRGLDLLPEKLTETTTSTEYSHGISGPENSQTKRRRVLDAEILIDIATTLDDAAIKLGFGPDGDAPEADPTENLVDPRGEER